MLKGQSHENGVSTKAMGSKFCTALKNLKRICDGSFGSSLTPTALVHTQFLWDCPFKGFMVLRVLD